jgi:hypothetical protein
MSELNTDKIPEAQLIESDNIQVPRKQLQALIDKLKYYEESEEKIATSIQRVMVEFGLMDKNTKALHPDLQNGNHTQLILKIVKDNFSLSDLLMGRKNSENGLFKKLEFLKELLPIFENYAKRK